MDYLGRLRLGEFLPVRLNCLNATGVPTDPVEAPLADIFIDTTKIISFRIPIEDKWKTVGQFQHRFFLGAIYSVGHGAVHLTYKIGSTHFAEIQQFDLIAGGDEAGSAIALHHFVPAHADFLLEQTDSGRLLRRRNPRVS